MVQPETRYSKPATTPLADPILIGRGPLLVELARRVAAGRHTLLVGPAGYGKTRLLREVETLAAGQKRRLAPAERRLARVRYARLAPGHTAIYVAESGPQSRLVDALAEALHARGLLALPGVPVPLRAAACAEYAWPEAKRLLPTVHAREEAVLTSLDTLPAAMASGRLVLLLDTLDRAGPAQARFLTALQRQATVIGAVRVVSPNEALRTFFLTFSRLDVPPLDTPDVQALVAHFQGRYGIRAADRPHYTREVVRRAEGNPAAVRAMMHDGARARLVTDQDVRDLQARDDAPFFNMGLVYVFALVGTGIARAFLAGSARTDLLIVLSVLTVTGYILFRVFRVFFIYQPKR